MSERIHDKDLMAYADGELNAAARQTVEAYLATHPEAAERVRAYRLLSRAARRAISLDTPVCSPELRARIDAAFDETSDAQPAASEPDAPDASLDFPPVAAEPSPPPRIHQPRLHLRPWIAAAAAALIVGIGLIAWLAVGPAQERSDELLWTIPPTAPPQDFDGTLSPTLVANVVAVHVKCAQLLDHFIAPEFGSSLEELSAPAAQHLGFSTDIPDLSALGYEYNGAGPCNILGGRTLHVLYRDREDHSQNVSVFVQPDNGQLQVDPDTLHVAAGPDAEYPTLVWRGSGRVYFIVADGFDTASETARVMSLDVSRL